MKFFIFAATTIMTLGVMTPTSAKNSIGNFDSTIANIPSDFLTKTSLENSSPINLTEKEVEYQTRRFRGRSFRRGGFNRRFRRGRVRGGRFHRGRFRRVFRRGRFH